MQELTISNDLLGQPAALAERWENDGYWFFRDVLDHEAVGRLRDRGLAFLRQCGLTDAAGPVAHYNGGDLGRLDPAAFEADSPWRAFVADPAIRDFFRRLSGADPEWIPVGECRMSPPTTDANRPLFDFIHSDGFFNPGMYFRTCWIPLVDMNEAMGGLAIAAGRRDSPILPPPTDGLPTISPDQIEPSRWRRADYRIGDVLLFDPSIAHSGLVNRSDAFRMSVDVRLSTDSARFPLVGTLRTISPAALTMEMDDGRTRELMIDADTLCRDEKGRRIPSERIGTQFQPGAAIVVAADRGKAIMVRAPK
jgi:hypothetical protein